MRIRLVKIFYILCLFTLASCQQANETIDDPQTGTSETVVIVQPGTVPSMEPYIFRTPEPGTASVHGELLVLDPNLMVPDPDDGIFFVPLSGGNGDISTIPFFAVGEVPQAEVDERTGEYMFTDIEPGQYAVVVLTRGGAQVPARFFQDGTLAIIEIKQSDRNQLIELDDLSIP